MIAFLAGILFTHGFWALILLLWLWRTERQVDAPKPPPIRDFEGRVERNYQARSREN